MQETSDIDEKFTDEYEVMHNELQHWMNHIENSQNLMCREHNPKE